MDGEPSSSSSVPKLSDDEDNTDIVVLNHFSPNSAALQNISDKKLLYCTQGEEKESLESCFSQEEEGSLLQLSNQQCCSTTGIATDFKIVFDPNGLFIPWELYHYIGFDLLRPLAKLQALQNMNLYLAIRNELCRRGKNGGLEMLDIAREIAVPSYYREIRALWNSYNDAVENDFEFVFIRIISFLHWANANIYSLTDLGLLDVEKLMLCYNCCWSETSTARKRFDAFMRQILFDMKDLLALRSWCGILREKTVFEVAMTRAEYLTVLDLGTMVPKGPSKKWNLKELFPKLKNLEDFTWLNCDVRTLVYLGSVNFLKRLVLHITKYDQIFFDQFFTRFGFDADINSRKSEDNEKGTIPLTLEHPICDDCNDPKSFCNISTSQCTAQETLSLSTSLVQSALTDLDQEEGIGDRVWISVKPPTKKVYLDYIALSFAHAILQFEEYSVRSWFGKVPAQLLSEKFHVPMVVTTANTIILNIPPALYQHSLLNLGTPKKKFGIGFPMKICANIKPNRISYGSVVQILESNKYNDNGCGAFAEEIEIHVMFDYYRKERVVHLFNLSMAKFFPKILRLHFTAAGRSMKKFYRWPRSTTDNSLFLRYLTVFELTLNCLTFQVPNVTFYSLTSDLEEVYVTLCGLPYNERETIQSVMEFFRVFMQLKENLRIVVFRTNAPQVFVYFFEFFETLSLITDDAGMNCIPTRLETLGIVCCVPETKIQDLSSQICNAIESIHPILRKQLKKLILDGRVWGALSAEHFAYVQNLLPNCTLEAELAPDDCKDLKYRRIYENGTSRNKNLDDICSADDSESEDSESPALDDGDEYLMRSDYSDATNETTENGTFAEIFASKSRKKGLIFYISRKRNRSTNRFWFSSREKVSNNIMEHSPQKKAKIPLRKQNSSNESSDEEWYPGIRNSKKT
ncbi:unnamed protein product [Wuchereria bancrofti]|uniref:Uncharacterized protein n=1 Tax=Wuchereria bancrofti TaxID=6293 RepID=A0A3P7DIT3_WUCBA|nr:unnamed protein product [Wuchereria bancrofti]